MNVVLWIVQAVLAIAFLGAGFIKVSRSRETLKPMMPWVEDSSDNFVRFVGAVEILGALGVILPAATKIVPVLTPIAAVGLVLVMIGALVVHYRRGEFPAALPPPLVLLLLAAFVAWGRFGPYSIS